MKLFDPARPKIGARLAYITPTGKPAGTIPPWTLYPVTQYKVNLYIYLMTRPNNAVCYQLVLGLAEFPQLHFEWSEDPEEWYRSQLGWQWEEIPSAPAKNKFSLSDIGL